MDDVVSIILPAHNAAATIGLAIESVCAQTHPHWELLIIVNGCTDHTSDVCRSYTDPRIRLIVLEEAGLSKARNTGLDLAHGTFICFLDADDMLPINSLSARVQLMAQHPEKTFCDGSVEKKSEDLSKLIEVWTPRVPADLHHEMHLIDACCFCGVTWMIRRSAIGQLRFDETWSHLEDRVFFLALSRNGQYGAVNDVVYTIRKTRGSLMSNHKQLEKAYRRFLVYVAQQDMLDPQEREQQRTFYKRMFFKTHLKSGRIVPALRTLFTAVYTP